MANRLGVASSLKTGDLCPVARSRLDRRLAARHGLGVRDVRGRRDLLEADGDPQGELPELDGDGWAEDKDADWGKPAQARDRGLGGCRGDGDPGAEHPGRDRSRRCHRPHGRRQDDRTTENHADAWFCGITPHSPRRSGWAIPRRDPDDERARNLCCGRYVPGPDLAALHGGGDRLDARARLPGAAVRAHLARVHARPVRGRGAGDLLQPTPGGADDDHYETRRPAPPPPPPSRRSPHRHCLHPRTRSRRRPSHRPPPRRHRHRRPSRRCDSPRASPRSQRLSICSPAPFPTAGSSGPSATGTSISTGSMRTGSCAESFRTGTSSSSIRPARSRSSCRRLCCRRRVQLRVQEPHGALRARRALRGRSDLRLARRADGVWYVAAGLRGLADRCRPDLPQHLRPLPGRAHSRCACGDPATA